VTTLADDLVAELTGPVGLGAVDAHRSAFIALSCAQGWTKARIGRYLGVSRARVGQRFDKLLHYATTLDTVPRLTEQMQRAVRVTPRRGEYDDLVEFKVEDWQDLDFARDLLARLVD
jgi:hypothetical protein